jgi:hypothetical protein
MDVIGHDDVSVQSEAAQLGRAKNRVFRVIGEFGIGQPERPATGGVQHRIELKKFLQFGFFLKRSGIPG